MKKNLAGIAIENVETHHYFMAIGIGNIPLKTVPEKHRLYKIKMPNTFADDGIIWKLRS